MSSIVPKPKMFPVGGGYQALSATPAVQIVDETLLGESLQRLFSDDTVQFEFPDCGPFQNIPYSCDSTIEKDTSRRNPVVRTVPVNVAVYGDSFGSHCAHNELFLREEYARMKERFEIQKWSNFSDQLSSQLAAQATDIGGGPYSLPHAVAALTNQASTMGFGPIVIHGPPGWLQAAAPGTLGTLNLRDQQVYFAASPGFANVIGPNGFTTLFASSAVHVAFEPTQFGESVEQVVVNNSKRVLFEARYAGATGCSFKVETTWCV